MIQMRRLWASWAFVLAATSPPALAETALSLKLDSRAVALEDVAARVTFADRDRFDTLTIAFESKDGQVAGRAVLVRAGRGNWRVSSVRITADAPGVVFAAGEDVKHGRNRIAFFDGTEARGNLGLVGQLAPFTLSGDALIPGAEGHDTVGYSLTATFDWPD